MNEVELHIDGSSFRRAVNQFAAALGKDSQAVLREQMGSLAKTLVRYTPPSSLTQGKKAVERDLKQLFVPVDQAVVQTFADQLGNRTIQGQYFAGDSSAAGTTGPIFNADGSNLAKHHAAFRDRRGRVQAPALRTITLGNRKIVNRMYVSTAAFASYLKQVQTHIGKAKASWLAAVRRWGATVPDYVSRQGADEGAAVDALTDDGGYLEAISKSEAESQLNQRLNILQRAMAGVERGLTIRLEKTLEKLAREASA